MRMNFDSLLGKPEKLLQPILLEKKDSLLRIFLFVWKKSNTKLNTNGCKAFLAHSHPLLYHLYVQ